MIELATQGPRLQESADRPGRRWYARGVISQLGIVDQSPVPAGSSFADALHNSVDLAQKTEAMGYSRYWVAEHHSSDGLAGSAPEMLIGEIARATDTIRVGSGGVMLTHYSSYKVAEQFRILEALHPGRIDLGLGRAPGSDQTTAAALAKGPGALGAEHYPAQIRDLEGWLADRPDPRGAFARVRATPRVDSTPELWLLASSEGSAAIAAHFGLPLCFAQFITMGDGPAIVDAYRRQYQPSQRWPEPVVTIATGLICAPTDAQADDLASSIRVWRSRAMQGPIPSVADALDVERNHGRSPDRPGRKPMICANPDRAATELQELADLYGADEALLVTITHDHEARVQSYALVARQFALGRVRQPL